MSASKASATVDCDINTTCPCGMVQIAASVDRATRFPTHMDNVVGLAQHMAADFCTACSPEPQRDAH